MVDDRQIVNLVLAGNTNSYSALVEKYYPRIISYICKTGVLREDAQDLSQEVFIRAYNNLYRYDSRWSFSTWIFRIAINLCRNYKKRKKVACGEINEAVLNDGGILPEGQYLDEIYNKQLVAYMFESLKKDVKEIMILRYYEGLSFDEISEICNISKDAAKMKISRALNKLRRIYGKAGIGGEYGEMPI